MIRGGRPQLVDMEQRCLLGFKKIHSLKLRKTGDTQAVLTGKTTEMQSPEVKVPEIRWA